MHLWGFAAQTTTLTMINAFYAPLMAAAWPMIAARTPVQGARYSGAEEWTFEVERGAPVVPKEVPERAAA